MADIIDDVLIDGKSLLSLRVVDLKQELKKRGIKSNGSKAQLQQLLISYLNQSDSTVAEKNDSNETFKQSDDEISQQITEPSDSSLGNEAPNALSVDDEDSHQRSHSNDLNEQLDGVSDLSKENAITSSVSINEEKNSIKLTIKLQPNDHSTKPSHRASDLSPKKEIKESAKDLSLNSVKQIEEIQTPVSHISPKVSEPYDLSSENTVITETVNNKEENKVSSQSSEEKNEQTVKPVLSSEKDVITGDLPVVEEKETPESVSITQNSTVIEVKETPKSPKTVNLPKIEEKQKLKSPSKTIIEEKETPKSLSNEETVKPKAETSDSSLEKIVDKENDSLEAVPKVEKVKPPRKRRWGSTTTGATDSQTNTNKGISSDQLKELIPEINSTFSTFSSATTSFTTTNALTVTAKVSKSDSSITVTSNLTRPQTTSSITEMPSKRDIRVVRKQVSVPEDSSAPLAEESHKLSAQTAKVEPKKMVAVIEESNESEEQEVKREVSPARNAESNIVYIRNLVRPFTLLQLKEVLGKTGKLIEEQFWIDKIKSQCFATYDTVSEAMATREALHRTRWPASNPKLLIVDFATKEDLDSHLNAEIGVNKEVNQQNVINNNKTNENVVNEKYDIIIKTDNDKSAFNETFRNKPENRPIREWDREKLINKEEAEKPRTPVKKRLRSPSPRSRSQERIDNRRRRHDSTKGGERIRAADQLPGTGPAAGASTETESPAKLLDDLFKKTTATPSIYWLPLTEEQVVARVALRAEIEKKKLEERNAREEQFRKRQDALQNERRGMEAEPPVRNERAQRRSNSPNRRNLGPRRMSPSRRPSPPRRSPPRRPLPARYSRSPVNRRSPPRRKR